MDDRRGPVQLLLWLAVLSLGIGGVSAAVTTRASSQLADRQLGWVVRALADPPSEAEVRAHVAPSFLAVLPPDEVLRLFAQMGSDGPYRVTDHQSRSATYVVAVVSGKRGAWDVEVGVRGPGTLITTLAIEPHVAPWTTAKSWADLGSGLARVAPEVGFLAAEIVDGECVTVDEIAAGRPRPLASVHKLYVLGALGEAIESGRVRWEQDVAIRADQIVNASDRFGTVEPGGLAQVRALAGAMIHQSDNTATEVLLDLVGREAVEQVQARMGMVRPEQNIPFLSLAEWARLKFGRPPSADEYAALPDVAARRRFIDERVANRSAGPRETTTPARPIHIDTVEWFASPEDICRAHVALQEMARRPGLEPLRSILRTTFTWLKPTADYIGFKGGSEPGVYDLTFYIERGGKRYAVVMLLSNPERHFRASPAIVRDAYRLLTASKAR